MSALVGLDVAVAVVGLAVLAGFTWRLWRQVKILGRSVSGAAGRLAEAQKALARVEQRTTARPFETYTPSGPARREGARHG